MTRRCPCGECVALNETEQAVVIDAFDCDETNEEAPRG